MKSHHLTLPSERLLTLSVDGTEKLEGRVESEGALIQRRYLLQADSTGLSLLLFPEVVIEDIAH